MREFKPHPDQLIAMEHLYEHDRCALWMPMGGGKTVTTLTTLHNLSLVDHVYPVLVLAPRRVAAGTWPDEVAKWDHLKHLRVSAIVGNVYERKKALLKEADIYTLNYDNLPWLREQLGDAWPFVTVVADEATRLKSFRLKQGGKRAQALGVIAHKKINRFIELTGTPSANGLQDLWGQIWFLDEGKRLGKSFAAFEHRWFRKGYDGYSIKPLPHAQEEIQERLKDICLTIQVKDVEKPIVHDIYVDLPRLSRIVYEGMEEEMFAQIGEHGVEAPFAAACQNKCMQIASGALYVNESKDWEELHREKIDALISLVEEANGAPVLVAYNFKFDLVRLRRAFPKARVLDTNPQTVRDWNAGRIQVLLAHPASAGHGLNMAEGGNILAFYGMNWSLEEHMQIIERIGPMRQKQAGLDRPVFVYRIIARNTIDETIAEVLLNKKSRQQALLDAMERFKDGVCG